MRLKPIKIKFMRKFAFIICLCLSAACSKEELDSPKENLITETYYYKNEIFKIDFETNSDGELIPITEIPSVLVNLTNLKGLAVVIEENGTYLFDDEKTKFEHYNLDYSFLEKSRQENLKNNQNTSKSLCYNFNVQSTISNINNNLYMYKDSYFKGSLFRLTSYSQFRNLSTTSGWNDAVSSVAINPSFVTPLDGNVLNRRKIIFYDDANFTGRSIEFYQSGYTGRDPFKYWYGSQRLKSVSTGWLWNVNFNDKWSSIDIIECGASIIL